MLLYKQKLYLSQVKYYNVNPIHGHLTRKICREKGHIATDRKYKDPNCYKKKITKRNNRRTTNANINADFNKHITQGKYEEN